MAYTLADQVRWSFAKAQPHVQEVIVLHESRKQGVQPDILSSEEVLDANFELVNKFARDAMNSLLSALQDGEILAKGRQDDRSSDINRGHARQFGRHSGFHTSISPEQWKEGSYYENCLAGAEWQFIDIELPRLANPDLLASSGGSR